MKDPAVLFYFQDFLVGTEFMCDEDLFIQCAVKSIGQLCCRWDVRQS